MLRRELKEYLRQDEMHLGKKVGTVPVEELLVN